MKKGWLFAGVVCGIFPGAARAAAQPLCQVESVFYAGSRLRLIVQTSQHDTPLYSHGSSTINVNHYFAEIDLGSSAPLIDRTKIVGPLSTPATLSPQKNISPPTRRLVDFNQEGVVFKMTPDGARWKRERLEITATGARWISEGTAVGIPELPVEEFQRNQISTLSGRHLVQKRLDGLVRLYDSMNGDRIDDPWIENTLGKLWELEDVKITLTDDLRFVVCWPRSGRYRDDAGAWVSNFSLDGKPYSREDFAILSARGDRELTAFPKGPGAFRSSRNERAFPIPFSLGEELGLVLRFQGRTSIVDRFNHVRFEIPGEHHGLAQVRSATGELVFAEIVPAAPLFLNTRVSVWNYPAGKIAVHEVDLAQLFKKSMRNELVPIRVLRLSK